MGQQQLLPLLLLLPGCRFSVCRADGNGLRNLAGMNARDTSAKAPSTKRNARSQTAEYRPPTHRRRFHHDDLVAVDLFSGFGGLTRGIELAGFNTICCANHNEFKVQVHEANYPHAEHWIADLVDTEATNYHSARDLPAADLLVAGVSCVNHSSANSQRAYEQGLSLFDIDDPDFDSRVTRSERDRATANCVLHYAAEQHPRMILVECTTELTSWGPAVPGRSKVGDGSTYRWWLSQFAVLGYEHRVLYLNSMFFGVPQSRDRLYIAFWDRRIPAPDLDHRPPSWCETCDTQVLAQWSWKTGVPPSGSVRYGKQYNYRCPTCHHEVIPPHTPALAALDLSNLGTRIGDRARPLAKATMARAERCRRRFTEFPAVVLPSPHPGHPWETADTRGQVMSTAAIMQIANGFEHPGSHCRSRDVGRPLWTQPASNSTAVLASPTAIAVNNFQGAPRGVDESLPTQAGSETLSLLSSAPTCGRVDSPLPVPAMVTAAGVIKNNGSIGEAKYRAHPVSNALGTVTSSGGASLLFSGWFKQNGSTGAETAAHPTSDPLGTLTSRDTTALLHARWLQSLQDLSIEDCYFRMMMSHEVGRGCGFDVDFPGYEGSFIVWGSTSAQVDGYGNAVSPQVGEWIGLRLRDALHSDTAPPSSSAA